MGKRIEFVKRAWEEFMEWIFPSNIYCIGCGAMIERDRPYSLCDTCMEEIHWIREHTCDRCGKALGETYLGRICYNCMVHAHRFRRGISCMTYGLKERQMILDFKYNGKGYMGIKFGDILADRLMADGAEHCEEISGNEETGGCGAPQYDIIVPVPIHPSRERKRGYNQTAIMAKRVSALTGIPVRTAACRRVKNTTLLRSMNPLEREAAMKDAFAVPEHEKPFVEGMRVLIMDDIITTGATADACADALLRAGAASVDLLTLAAGANRRPGQME